MCTEDPLPPAVRDSPQTPAPSKPKRETVTAVDDIASVVDVNLEEGELAE